MFYTVYYKKPGALFWHKVKNVEGDTTLESEKGHVSPMRVLLLSDKTRLEVPMTCLVKFSKERFFDIQANMEREAGQKIMTKQRRQSK